jgi:GMP synthase (glutamine-hydrolysing)
VQALKPSGIILSGGPDSVCREGSPSVPAELFEVGIPILGICYGLQLIAHTLKGCVIPGADHREFGKAMVDVFEPDTLFAGLPQRFQAWMSHGDRVESLPPDYKILAKSGDIIAAAADEKRKIWGLQFHPEVVHTHNGAAILENFLTRACGCKRDWTMAAFIESTVQSIKAKIGEKTAICGLSGGVDSTVAALLVHKAIGDKLTCVFVDNGLLRKDEFTSVLTNYRERLHLKNRSSNEKSLERNSFAYLKARRASSAILHSWYRERFIRT